MASELKPGGTVKVTVNKNITRDSARKKHERCSAKLQREHEYDARDKNLGDNVLGFKAATKSAPILDGDRVLRIVGRAQRLRNPAARDKQSDPYQRGSPWLEGQLAR